MNWLMKLIADNLRITKPDIQKAFKTFNPEPLQTLVKECEAKGAWAIDVNTGPLGTFFEEGISFFIQSVQEVTDLPLMIDTSNSEAMKAGLAIVKNRPIINGFSLESRKLGKILPLAKEYDVDIIGFLLYPDSRVPKDEAQRYEIVLELFEQVQKAGVPKERIIIDPVVPPLAWDDGIIQARAVLNVIKTLPDLLGFPVRTIAGLSNLTTGAQEKYKKDLIETNYAALLAEAGLDYLLMDILNEKIVKSANTADILLTQDIFSWGLL